ncbi:MAG: gamma carbonic anhydrase family protein [Nitrososphaeria archaeon]
MRIGNLVPEVHEEAFVAETAYVAGNVKLAKGVNVLPGAVIRGDEELISVDEFSNVQDNAVLHADPGFPTRIGKRVTIGHAAIVHGATVNDDCLIGMGSILLNGSVIGRESIVAAGAIVTEGKKFTEGSVLMGSPARVVRKATSEDLTLIKNSYIAYLKLKK